MLVVELENKPGAFSSVCNRLAAERVNISYAYCTGGAPGGRTTAVFKVTDLKKAEKVLAAPASKKKARKKAKAKQSRTVKKAPRS